MSEQDIWVELARRASESKFSGVTSETDDLLGDVFLKEAPLNPSAANGAHGAGAPGMMPPMMMGGMGGGREATAASSSGKELGISAPTATSQLSYSPREGLPLAEATPVQTAPKGAIAAGADLAPEVSSAPAIGGSGQPLGSSARGVAVGHEQIQSTANLWDELSQMYDKVSTRIPRAKSLGFALAANEVIEKMTEEVHRRGQLAAKEFQTIAEDMRSTSQAYAKAEDEAARAARSGR